MRVKGGARVLHPSVVPLHLTAQDLMTSADAPWLLARAAGDPDEAAVGLGYYALRRPVPPRPTSPALPNKGIEWGDGTVPTVRKIYRCLEERRRDEAIGRTSGTSACEPMLCAYHVTNCFPESHLRELDALRERMPVDTTRPTCPRRFLSEHSLGDTEGPPQHFEDGWVGQRIDEGLRHWGLGDMQCLPWFRFLEYSEGGGMAKHSDGDNEHPVTGKRSEATMLIYLSTCDKGGGETALFRKLSKREKYEAKKRGVAPETLVERVGIAWNTALIFPHAWQHEGCPVLSQPKIAMRCQVGRMEADA